MKKIGLALGSGSAKGFAHIGVLQVLLENGIPVHMVTGSSMGAIIGSIYAVGTDLYMLQKYIGAIETRSYIDMVLSKSGFLAGEKLKELVRLFTHNKSFDQTSIPFACVATDIETGEVVVLDSGRLCDAVRASMSIPGVFVPVRHDGRLLVDGGVIERVPCLPLRAMGADIIIGVDVGYRGGRRPVPQKESVAAILESCVGIMQWEITKLRTEGADLMICPEVSSVEGIGTERAQYCIEQGRLAAEAALPRIRELLNDDEPM